MNIKHGILMAGGYGLRLRPMTRATSKHLLPVYNKPMIYYSLGTLMLAGIRNVAIVTTVEDQEAYVDLLGWGDKLGMKFEYCEQNSPGGIAQAFSLAEDCWRTPPVALMLGDNIFHGAGWQQILRKAIRQNQGATVFAYPVNRPSSYGVVELNSQGYPQSIEEKPAKPKSNLAITGLYLYDESVWDRAADLEPSTRGEWEVTSLNERYMLVGKLEVQMLPRGMAWLDAGTPYGLLQASNFVATMETRQGQSVFCLEEIAFKNGWINEHTFHEAVKKEGPDYYKGLKSYGYSATN